MYRILTDYYNKYILLLSRNFLNIMQNSTVPFFLYYLITLAYPDYKSLKGLTPLKFS